jgi:choice-of-anchor A domain-containing protein
VLGAAAAYNGFFFAGYTAQSSDVQGRLAAGGNVSLNNYSIGDQLPGNFSGPSLIVGGDLTFPSGRVYRGDILVGGSAAGVGAPVVNGLGPDQRLIQNAPIPVDFAAERTRLIAESQRLASFPANTTFEYQWGGLYLHGDNSSNLQVFNLDGQQVLDAHTFQVDRIPAGATVLFNIKGTSTGLTNMSLSSLIPNRNKVLFNFHQATTLQLAGVSVEGSILAPIANIENPQGVIWGTVVANSWNGQMQINLAAHDGCVVAPTAPPSLCTTTPSAPVKVGAGQGTFTPFAPLERLEVRGGRTGAADWEWGLGTNTQTAGQFVQEHLNWTSGKSYRLVLSYNGQGGGSYQVFDGNTSLFTKSFSAMPGLRTGNAVELYAKSSAGTGNAKVIVNLTRLKGSVYNEMLQTLGNNAFSEAKAVFFSPALSSGFELEGTVKLEFTGTAPPTGSRLNFLVTAGNLSCSNGVAP